MKVIDIDKKIDEEIANPTHSEPIVIPIQDSQRIKTRYRISDDCMAAFGIEERNSYTIMQMSPEADEEDEDWVDTVFADPEQKETIHYYAFEKDCCCGLIKLIKLSDDPPVYLNVEPRFQLNISQMLEIVKENGSWSEKLIRKSDCEIKHDDIPADLWNALWDHDGNSLKDSRLDTLLLCAISMSKLFELYAGVLVKKLFPKWNCFFEEGKAKLMPTSENEYKFYITGYIIPDIVLEKDGKYIILDAKYKDYNQPNRDDRLQLLAYADVYDAHIIGHVFPQGKEKDRAFQCGQINTQCGEKYGEKYFYIQFALRDSNENLKDLRENLQGIIKNAGLVDTNDTE